MFNGKSVNSENIDYSQERAFVSQLLLAVLCEKISVKDALLKFPKDVEDASIVATWHALSHYEADEDLRIADASYKSAQDDYLEFIALSLRDNKDLPVNVVSAYNSYYKDMPIADNETMKGKMHKFLRFLNIN